MSPFALPLPPRAVDPVAGLPDWVPLLPLLALAVAIACLGDLRVFRLLQQAHGVLPAGWAALGVLGLGVTALLLPALVVRRQPAWLAATLLGFPFAGLGAQGLKTLLDVPRPAGVLGLHGLEAVQVIGQPLMAHSLPSGHALTAFACATLALKAGPAWARRAPGALAVLALATAVALSRCVTGAHWPADLVIGGLLGWASARLALALVARWHWPQRLGEARWRRPIAAGQAALGLGVWWASTGYPSAWPLQWALGACGVVGAAWTLWGPRWQGRLPRPDATLRETVAWNGRGRRPRETVAP